MGHGPKRFQGGPWKRNPIAQAEFDQSGHAITLRALKSDQSRDIFDANQPWTDEVNWTAGGTALTLRSNDRTAQVSRYADETQWAVQSEMTPANLLDTVDAIFAALGTQDAGASEQGLLELALTLFAPAQGDV